MSEREDLQEVLDKLGWKYKVPAQREGIRELLAQPEPFKPDWANYRQGVEDATREPLSEKEIQDALIRCRQSTTWDYGFEAGIEFAEEFHGIRSR